MQLKPADDVVTWLRRRWTGEVDWDSHNSCRRSRDEEKWHNLNKANDDERFDKEFEETDLGQLEGSPSPVLIKTSERRGRPKLGRKFNVVMPDELIIKLQEAGNKRGLGYQTMVRLICSEHIAKYLEMTKSDQE